MSIEIDGIPAWVDQAILPILPIYEREVVKYADWFEGKGRQVVRLAAGSILGKSSAVKKAGLIIGKKVPQPPNIVKRVIDPVLDPLLKGAKVEAWKVAKPILIGGIVVFTMTTASAFFLGRWSGAKKVARKSLTKPTRLS